MGGRHALRNRWACFDVAMVVDAGPFLVHGGAEHHFQERTGGSLRRTFCR